jgi:hypothetical protein
MRSPQDQASAGYGPQDENRVKSTKTVSSASSKSLKDSYEVGSNKSIETLALQSQLKTAKHEISSLQRRNYDLEKLL